MADPSRSASPRKAPCPICGAPPEEGFKPFCSSRCAKVDLNRWLSGAYVIEGGEEEDSVDHDAAE